MLLKPTPKMIVHCLNRTKINMERHYKKFTVSVGVCHMIPDTMTGLWLSKKLMHNIGDHMFVTSWVKEHHKPWYIKKYPSGMTQADRHEYRMKWIDHMIEFYSNLS